MQLKLIQTKRFLKIIIRGITKFDVASVEEIKTINEIDPSLQCSYMHTVKSKKILKMPILSME